FLAASAGLAAWVSGRCPALPATMLGTLAANALFLSPYRPLVPFTERDIIGQLLFLVLCAAIIAVGEGGRRALLRLDQVHEMLLRSRMQLKFRVRQRTAQLQQSNKDLRDLSAR